MKAILEITFDNSDEFYGFMEKFHGKAIVTETPSKRLEADIKCLTDTNRELNDLIVKQEKMLSTYEMAEQKQEPLQENQSIGFPYPKEETTPKPKAKGGKRKKVFVHVHQFIKWCVENNVNNGVKLCAIKRPEGICSTPNKTYEGFKWSDVTKAINEAAAPSICHKCGRPKREHLNGECAVL